MNVTQTHWSGSPSTPVSEVEPLRFRRAPLFAAALAFCLGDLLAHPALAYRPPILLLGFTILLATLTLAAPSMRSLGWQSMSGSNTVPILSVLALWLVTGFWSSELQPAPPSQRDLATYADGLSRTVRGRITRIRALPPRTAAQDFDTDASEWEDSDAPPVLSFDLAVDSIERITPDTSQMVPIEGGVRVTLTGTAPALRCGDNIEAPLRLRTPERYRDPGAWQYADYLAAQGIGSHATLAASRLIIAPATASHPSIKCRLYAAQTSAASRLLAFTASHPNRLLPKLLRLTPDDAGMLNAMLFGDRDRLNHTLRLGFERTGSFHLFVVSGMHVALLAAALFWITRRLRIPPVPATLITIAATAAYALLTGFGAPVQRALLMSSIFLIARLLQRQSSVLNALGAAVLGVLILSPSSLYESSFQMTFLVIVAIAGIAIPLAEWTFLPYARATRNLDHLWLDPAMHPRLSQFRILLRIYGEHLAPLLPRRARHLPATLIRCMLWALELLLISLVAELVMLLPMALYFHRATLFALPANAFSIPLVAVLAPLALVTFLLSLISPWLAAVPAAATALTLHAITGIIARISSSHLADFRIPGPSLLIAAIAILAWLACCYLVRRSRKHALIAALALPLIAAMILWPEPTLRTPNTLEVTAIDVGQGDSLLLVTPEGRTMLIDAGGPVGRGANAPIGNTNFNSGTTSFDIGEDVVSPYLWSRRIRRLDIVVLTHAHSDHMGGMPAILRNFRPRELWVGIDPASPAYNALLGEAAALNIRVRHLHAGDATDLDQLHITTLAPAPAYQNPGPPVNNDSVVLRVDYGLASALLEGDAEAPSERAMLAANAIHPVTLLKIGHHGSRTSTTPEFFAAAAPRAAVISVGRDNTFGHPRPEVITRIAAARIPLYRTDRFGLAQFLLTKDGNLQEIGEDGVASPARPASR